MVTKYSVGDAVFVKAEIVRITASKAGLKYSIVSPAKAWDGAIDVNEEDLFSQEIPEKTTEKAEKSDISEKSPKKTTRGRKKKAVTEADVDASIHAMAKELAASTR